MNRSVIQECTGSIDGTRIRHMRARDQGIRAKIPFRITFTIMGRTRSLRSESNPDLGVPQTAES